ncbi:sugar ABC transporter permease, partial [Vibrio sp. 10N.222.55.E8]
ITLGDVAQTREGFTIIQGDHSVFLLVEGVIALIAVFVFLCLYTLNINDAKSCQPCQLSAVEQIKAIYDRQFALLVLSPALLTSIAFIIMPIVITVLVSFTN